MFACLSLCLPQTVVLSKRIRIKLFTAFTQLIVHVVWGNLNNCSIRVGYFSLERGLKLNLVGYSAFSPRHVDRCKWRQLSSTGWSLSITWASTFVYSTLDSAAQSVAWLLILVRSWLGGKNWAPDTYTDDARIKACSRTCWRTKFYHPPAV